jgi:hypothetical protein
MKGCDQETALRKYLCGWRAFDEPALVSHQVMWEAGGVIGHHQLERPKVSLVLDKMAMGSCTASWSVLPSSKSSSSVGGFDE